MAAAPDTGAGQDPILAALEEASELLAEKDFASAAEVFAAVLGQEPGNLDALAGLGQCYLGVGELDQAEGLIAQVPEEHRSQPPLSDLVKAMDLVRMGEAAGDVGALQAKVDTDPSDHDARFDLAMAQAAAGAKEDAAKNLIEIVRQDRTWRDDGARTQLVEFFDVWGPKDPATSIGRRALSSVLFS